MTYFSYDLLMKSLFWVKLKIYTRSNLKSNLNFIRKMRENLLTTQLNSLIK